MEMPAHFWVEINSLVDIYDTTTFTIGVGRKFTDNWSGAASFTYEKSGNDSFRFKASSAAAARQKKEINHALTTE